MVLLKRYWIILFICLSAISQQAMAQVNVKGQVLDSTGMYPIHLVSVLSSRGSGTLTDSNGYYSILLNETDSIWFSYLNKPTKRFAVKDIKTPYAFNIAIQAFIPILPEVKTRNRNYRQDSLQNREDYAKIFNYSKPGVSIVSGNGTVGVGLEDLINSFRFKKNKRTLAFQDRLITQEQEGFVKYRFSKLLVRRITQETDDSELNKFMLMYQPSYLFTVRADDYNFHKYVKDSWARYKRGYKPTGIWLEGETSEN